LESLTKQEDRQRYEERHGERYGERHGERYGERHGKRHGKRHDSSIYSEYRPHRDVYQIYREFSTNYKKSYNQQKAYYQKESFVKPYYFNSYNNDSRLDKMLVQDRGINILVKSWSRNNL
jgi:hypothetical protein